MGLDDPFPIEKCSGRVRGAVLAEFQGRCPTVREVASISDTQWLTVPNIGPTTLEELRSLVLQVANGQAPQILTQMEDDELLSRLNRIQRDLSIVAGEIRMRIAPTIQRKRPRK